MIYSSPRIARSTAPRSISRGRRLPRTQWLRRGVSLLPAGGRSDLPAPVTLPAIADLSVAYLLAQSAAITAPLNIPPATERGRTTMMAINSSTR